MEILPVGLPFDSTTIEILALGLPIVNLAMRFRGLAVRDTQLDRSEYVCLRFICCL